MSSNLENKSPLALVLGSTGGIGSHVATMLLERGWRVRCLTRRATTRTAQANREEVLGDAMNRDDVLHAAEGVELIVHAVNPPGYRNWGKLVLPMLGNTIHAAEAVGARILLPGTVYNFGPDAFPVLTEDSPQNPKTRKGAIRRDMEQRLRAASERGVPVLIVRAGDFFGPGANNNWFSQGLIKPGQKITSITNPGKAGVGHQWAYLPDVAETMGQLLDRRSELESFAVYHMDGFWDANGRHMPAVIERVIGHHVAMKSMPWWFLRLASPLVPIFRELSEMRYLWKTPLRMSNAKLVAFLGSEPRIQVDEAVRATLVDLKCL